MEPAFDHGYKASHRCIGTDGQSMNGHSFAEQYFDDRQFVPDTLWPSIIG